MNYKAPRGTHDIWGGQAAKLHKLEEASREVFARYDFAEIRMPTFEDAALFTRSIGEATDIVEKEMYVFEDRKGRRLALRPEGTASVVRAYLENNLAQQMSVSKLFYSGSMFRYERPQAGRYREFFQIGAEYFGNASPVADAEIVLLARDVLAAVGLRDIKVHLHTLGCSACRVKFRESLQQFFSPENREISAGLCQDCQRRIVHNPLRVLDCKIDRDKFEGAPKMEAFLCEECGAHFRTVQELLTAAGCAFHVDHHLVRGLDYYTRTVFEIRSAGLGSQDALAAGGRYDNLVRELGGPVTPAVGFALGSERVMMAVDNLGVPLETGSREVVFVAAVNRSLEREALAFASRLRSSGKAPRLVPEGMGFTAEGPYAERSVKSQMRLADKLKAFRVVIFGEEEFARGAVIVRDMRTQTQEEIPLSELLPGS